MTPLIYEDPPILTPPFSNFVHTHCSFSCLVSLPEWVIMPHLMCYLTQWYYGSTHVQPWYLSIWRTLLCVLSNKVSSLLRSNTCDFLIVLIDIWFDIIHASSHPHTLTHEEDTKYTQGPRDWHTHINKCEHHLLCAHNSYLYHIGWIIRWNQNFALQSSTMPLLFKNYL